MCLAIPGRILSITEGENALARSGQVDFSGIRNEISLAYVPEAKVNDYVIVHAGFALSALNQDEASATLDAFTGLSALSDEPERY